MDAKTDGVVLGVSGGIDSAVVAYLSVEALGSKRVLGLLMPDLRVTPQSDMEDAKQVVEDLAIQSRLIDIAPIHNSFIKQLQRSNIAEGNLRARIRMGLSYYHANLSNRLVVGTGDRSESVIGYFTKFGDGGVDILPIGDLYKTEVRQLGEALGVSRRIILKRSSPRLWPNQTAESDIGLPYTVIDQILEFHFEKRVSVEKIASLLKIPKEKVGGLIARNRLTAHKRGMPEVCKLR